MTGKLQIKPLALKANWVHPPDTEKWLKKMSIGRTLNVCCGLSNVGDVRLDTDPKANRTEPGDLFNLDYPNLSFDTVICDPPFSYYNQHKWILKLADLARRRLMLSVDRTAVRLSREMWADPQIYVVGIYTFPSMYLRLYEVFDRFDTQLPTGFEP